MRNVPRSLRFPLAGLAKNYTYRESTLPTEERTYATPMAMNVVGECAFSGRLRGGSRPGLKALADQPVTPSDGKWLWPNGEPVIWPSGENMTFAELGGIIDFPDGRHIINQHPTFNVRVSSGAVPEGCTVMTLYRNRLVVAKETMWYASRTASIDDFDYGGDGEDPSRAAAGNVALAGCKGEDVTALIPVNDRVLYICTSRAIRAVNGEPTSSVSPISDNVGVISKDAWCFDSRKVYFAGPRGLYAMAPGESPLLLSAQIPEELKGLSSATLVYDPERNGIHILSTNDWFYDIDNRAFWPVTYPSAKRPSMGGVAMVGGVNTPVFLCADGAWRTLSDDSQTDDGTDITSFVALGPFRNSQHDDTDGMLDVVTATMALGSAPVTVSVYTAHSAERAVWLAENTRPAETFTVGAGWNPNFRPRTRGAWCVIVVESDGKWAYESILATSKLLGRLRP